MKKRVLATLLAICMIFGSCLMLASAADNFAAGDYVSKKTDGKGWDDATNLRVAKSGTDFNVVITVEEKTSVQMSLGTKEINADNIDTVFNFKAGTTALSFKGSLDKYFSIVSGTCDADGNIVVSFKETAGNKIVLRTVKDAFTSDGVASLVEGQDTKPVYIMSDSEYTATVDKWVTKLASLQIGVRFYGKTYDNLVAAEIAQVNAVVNRTSGRVMKVTSGTLNKIEDLMPGDTVTLTTELKDPTTQKGYYGFNCWVDGNGNVISTADEITVTMTGDNVAVYASYIELRNRFTIDFTTDGNGSIAYVEDKIVSRELFKGDDQMSAMQGRNVKFYFVPDEGYVVSKVRIDGVNVTSFLRLVEAKDWAELKKAIKELVNATDKDKMCYTFYNLSDNHSIEVVFEKEVILEAPDANELETVAAEGLTLATGAADENAEGGEGGAKTTVPAEGGANGGSAETGVVNPATGSSASSSIAVFAAITVAAGAAFVTLKKKEN